MSLGGIGQTAVGLTASLLGLSSIMDTAFRGVKLAANAESLATTFRVLVGDAELAMKTLKDLEAFAVTTPFEMPELLEASKQMIAFGEDASTIVPSMRMLGDVSAGLGIRIQDLTYLYGTLRSQGRAFTVDIRQFAMRGIPIYLELAKVMGLVGKETKKLSPEIKQALNKMIEEGAVNFDLVEKAFKNMTGTGGQFFNLMEERSKTIEGLFNEMRESIDLNLREMGKTIIEGLQLHVVVRQVTRVTEQVNHFLKTMDGETKKAILIGMGLVGVFVAIKAAIYAAGIALTVFTGGANLWAGAIATAIALTGLWVYEMGGLEKAWVHVKKAAIDFWAFIKPVLPLIGTLIAGVTFYFAPWLAALALVVYYWDDVLQAVKDAYNFIKPTLRALWSLIKTVSFAIRDSLVVVWDRVVAAVKRAAETISDLWARMTGGQKIDWGKVKDGLRDMMFFAEYVFNNISSAGTLAWDMIKFSIFYALDEIAKNFLLVPVVIIGAFVVMAKTIGELFEKVMLNVVSGVGEAAKAIWEAIKSGDVEAAAKKVKDAFVNKVIDAQATITGVKESIQKAVGKISFNEVEMGGIKVVAGVNIEGLQKERQAAYGAVRRGMKDMEKGFGEFKAEKMLKFQFEDASALFMEVWKNIVTPFMFPKSEVVAQAADAGNVAGQAFKSEFKKVEAVLFSSTEALSRMAEYREKLPNVVKKTDVRSMVMAQQPPVQPNQAELEMVGLMRRLVDLTQKEVNKEPLQIVPADIP